MNITFYYSEIETIKKIIQYIDDRFNSGEHGDSYWVDHCGERITTDTGYAYEWWENCMKPELDDWIGHLENMPDKEDTYKRGEWDLFCLITSVAYGKQRFCDDFCGTVYDRSKCDHLKNRDEAIDRYLKEIGDNGEY